MSFQKSHFFRDVVLSPFILLIFIIMNEIYGLKSSNSPSTTYTQFYNSPSRQLSEYLRRLYRVHMGNYYSNEEEYEYEQMMRKENLLNEAYRRKCGDASRSYSMPYRIDEEDVSRELSKKELRKLINSFGPKISERDMYITFYYYHSYLQHRYSLMLLKLERKIYKLGAKRKIPDEDLNMAWLVCKRRLSRLLFSLNYFSYKQFYEFAMDSPFEDTSRFKKFLASYVKRWKKQKRSSKKILSTELIKKIKQYKRR
ncbi:Plasmodium exported protein, unknown function [Plasmodium knowlesi strain H]|uniref:Plasmodium RESA N-terminal domain-containing protein n=3 Tax=Plasmodium knowlesi TaxID=5850 RepID=A0A5E7WZ65_PLAKH|nr:Plasmodium exported protein (PHIST), unknown function [Plasmodium knowlesi strain H]OTN66033.1 Uncharacterized protein PKNOH_S100036500 [Plasmodium knowlesi]CAA9987728.1 Plasmodium exported protein (PHIST), unknown function [Plasmodium knowlesi strain H]SBO27049.1 Plasmodium exported protein, unknown function [Plasmodium knowlesi strain H]SBO29468.1 Plasmodium exported protein, unknown function [Plasmodium knowlesi strain H]VVS77202.1 Plasmodium exported protein (PHIST), unknown function [P